MNNYIKLIFKYGSVIIRRISDYHYNKELDYMYYTLETGEEKYVDMFVLTFQLGNFIKIKSNF